MIDSEAVCSIALTMVRGLGPSGAMKLLGAAGSAEAVFGMTDEELAALGLRVDLARSIASRATMKDAEREAARAEKCGIRPVPFTSPHYPPLLKECGDAPAVIYVMGDVAALGRRMLSVVGTRRMTQYGLTMCERILGELVRRVPDLCIVSGLAFGVDSAAHRTALRYGTPTVGVVASVLPEITPSQHRELAGSMIASGGAVVSELGSHTHQNGNLYIPRNRLIAGISEATLVIESAHDGGAMHTASFADGYYRTVLAVPGRATDSLSFGPNLLIRTQKAQMVCSAEDVIRELSWDLDAGALPAEKPDAPELTAAQRAILRCFGDRSCISSDELCVLCAMSAAELAPLLLEMEFCGLLRKQGGNIYEKLC